MSREFLNKLNGDKKGEFKRFIDSIDGDISIAWYPCAEEDFKSLADIYLQTKASGVKQPDIFLCTDYCGFFEAEANRDYKSFYEFLFPEPHDSNDRNYYDDSLNVRKLGDGIEMHCLTREYKDRLRLPIHPEIVYTHDRNRFCECFCWGKVIFLKVLFKHPHYPMGDIPIPILYVIAENEAFAAEVMLPNNAQIDLILHKVYGGTFQPGRGNWLENILKRVQCKNYLKFYHFPWSSGDYAAVKIYPCLGEKDEYEKEEFKFTPLEYIGDSFKRKGENEWWQIK